MLTIYISAISKGSATSMRSANINTEQHVTK